MEFLTPIKNMPHLRELRLSNNNISDFSNLPNCKFAIIAIDGNIFDLEETQSVIDEIDAKIKIYATE